MLFVSSSGVSTMPFRSTLNCADELNCVDGLLIRILLRLLESFSGSPSASSALLASLFKDAIERLDEVRFIGMLSLKEFRRFLSSITRGDSMLESVFVTKVVLAA